jgi:hypothetical protein
MLEKFLRGICIHEKGYVRRDNAFQNFVSVALRLILLLSGFFANL